MTTLGVIPHYWDSLTEVGAPTGLTAQAPPLVLLHGFPFSSTMWLHQRGPLAAQCRVITPDQRGFGATALNAGTQPPSLRTVANDLVALLDELQLPSVVLGGSSMGGYVAMEFLRHHPERVSGLILADTRASIDSQTERANREHIATTVEQDSTVDVLLENFLPKIFGPTTSARRISVITRVRKWILEAAPTSVAWAQRAMAARDAAFDTLANTNVPTLVIVGDEDEVTPVSESVAIFDVMPRAELVRLAGTGHMSNVEDPTAFNAVVSEFLSHPSEFM